MANTLRIKDVAAAAGVSRHTIYYWIANGRMPEPIKGSKPPRWNEAEIVAWLAPSSQQAEAE